VIALVREQGCSVPEVAKSLGINVDLLYRWKPQIEDKQKGKTLTKDKREELNRLGKENKLLCMGKVS